MCLMTFLMTSVTTVSSQILQAFSLQKKEWILIARYIVRMRISILFKGIQGIKNMGIKKKKKKVMF